MEPALVSLLSSPKPSQTEMLGSTLSPPVLCHTSTAQDERPNTPAYVRASTSCAMNGQLENGNALSPRRYANFSQPDHRQPPSFAYSSVTVVNRPEIIQAFLRVMLDKAGNPQPIYWSVNDLGTSCIGKNEILVFQCNLYTDCYGRVERLLEADAENALLEVRLLGWNSMHYGLKVPDAILIALAAVSRERLVSTYDEEARLRSLSHNVIQHAFTAITNVHDYLRHRDVTRIPRDPTTLALMDAFIENPDMQHFHPGLSTSTAYVFSDRILRLAIHIPEPPPRSLT
ncbi:unnamed protein product [Peniophora sp. CBMAI 1063]|nr:unnamed protein product [Peniophora sp. CBMAI 1063]